MLMLLLALVQSPQQDSICTPVKAAPAAMPAPLKPARRRVLRAAGIPKSASAANSPGALAAAKLHPKRKPRPIIAARTKALGPPARVCHPAEVAMGLAPVPAVPPGPPVPVDPAFTLRPLPPAVTEEVADPAPVPSEAPAAPGAVTSAAGKSRLGLIGLGAALGSGLFLAFLGGNGSNGDALTPVVPSSPPPTGGPGPGPGPGGNPPPVVQPPVTATPEPATLVLVGSGLVGAGLAARRRRKQRED